MSKLYKMRERLNGIDDPELLAVAQELLSDMADVARMKEQIEMREAKFSEGRRAAFYFFAQSLEPEELMHAANTAKGRIRVLREKEEAQERRDRIERGEDPNPKPEVEDESVPMPQGNFGGLGSSFSA